MHAEQLAQLFHETYERLAPDFGYQTRKESAVPWTDVPAALRQSCYLNGRVPHISMEEMDSHGVQAVRLSTDCDDIRLEFPLLEEGRELVRSVHPSSRGEESENES